MIIKLCSINYTLLKEEKMLGKMKEMFEAQKKLAEMKKNLESMNVDYQTLGGNVKVVMSGTQRIMSIELDKDSLTEDNKPKLERALVDCINGAAEKVQKLAAQQLKSSMGDFKIPGM